MKAFMWSVIGVVVSLAFLAGGAWGMEFCVSTATELRDALNTAWKNGEADVIKVVQGTYVGNFNYSSSEGYGITLQGGYTAGCTDRVLDPNNTVLDGNNSGMVLYLFNGGDIAVEGFTIRNGSTTGSGGGVYAYSLSSPSAPAGAVTLSNNVITNNSANNYELWWWGLCLFCFNFCSGG